MHLNASENMVGKLLSSHLNATALRGDNGWAEIKLRTFPSPKDYSDAILRMVVAHSAGTSSTPQIIQRIHQGAKCSPPYKPDIKPNARDTEVGFQRTIQMLKRLNGTARNCKLPSFLSPNRYFTSFPLVFLFFGPRGPLVRRSWGSGLLQMIIRRIRPLANDHPADPATCKWSSVSPITLITSPRIQNQSRGPS